MLIAHVEARGVWLIEGGMSALAEALKSLAEANGARFRLGEDVARIETDRKGASGVVLANGERIAADAVLCNADPAALAHGCFGEEAQRAVGRVPQGRRSPQWCGWRTRRPAAFPCRATTCSSRPTTAPSSTS